jgi:hypothetical protein
MKMLWISLQTSQNAMGGPKVQRFASPPGNIVSMGFFEQLKANKTETGKKTGSALARHVT